MSHKLPGRNPGTSTNVMIGILKQSKNLTNLAAFTDAFISRQPIRIMTSEKASTVIGKYYKKCHRIEKIAKPDISGTLV